MALLDAKPEQPHSKTLRYAVSGVALAILLTFALWYVVLRFLPEKRVVTQFMDAVVAEKFETAYQDLEAAKLVHLRPLSGGLGLDGVLRADPQLSHRKNALTGEFQWHGRAGGDQPGLSLSG